MPDDHSELVPPLPIPNRTVKRLHANDSADSRVKVGNRQAPHLLPATRQLTKTPPHQGGVFAFLILYNTIGSEHTDPTASASINTLK